MSTPLIARSRLAESNTSPATTSVSAATRARRNSGCRARQRTRPPLRFEFFEQASADVAGGAGEQDEFVCGHADLPAGKRAARGSKPQAFFRLAFHSSNTEKKLRASASFGLTSSLCFMRSVSNLRHVLLLGHVVDRFGSLAVDGIAIPVHEERLAALAVVPGLTVKHFPVQQLLLQASRPRRGRCACLAACAGSCRRVRRDRSRSS